MNAYLNYLLEANLGLCFFLALYFLLLNRETDFRVKRAFILTAILVSLLFPLFHFNTTEQVATLSRVIPPTWLPEVVVVGEGNVPEPSASIVSVWFILNSVYVVGVVIFLIIFLIRLGSLLKKMQWVSTYTVDRFKILESSENTSSFSFFRFIFIGQADRLSHGDKEQIIRHESIHSRQLHSIDILLVHVLSIIFWFNPLLRVYKKIFVQLHEFEADARAVEHSDVNDYCNLMARVALLSADIKLANHFSNSLTLKRIEMIRTIKTKVTRWKLIAILTAFPAFFFLVSCQDQIIDDATHIAQNSTMALDYPKQVQDKLDELKKLNPDHKFVVLEPDEKATDLAGDMEKKIKELDPTYISSMHVMKDLADSKGVIRSFIVIDYDEHAKVIAGRSVLEGEIFTVVEESATMPGGLEALGKFLQQNLRYPKEAREQGKEGNIFVQFVVNKDGSLSDLEVTKGVDELLDKEALRVVGMLPKWNPGKQNGSVVRQRFVLPVAFRLANNQSGEISAVPAESGTVPSVVVVGFGGNPSLAPVNDNMKITSSVRTNIGGKKRIEGTIYDSSNNPLPGANIVVKGGTTGTKTDINGNFSIDVPVNSGELAVSFVGFKTETISF